MDQISYQNKIIADIYRGGVKIPPRALLLSNPLSKGVIDTEIDQVRRHDMCLPTIIWHTKRLDYISLW